MIATINHPNEPRSLLLPGLIALALVALHIWLAALSPRFAYAADPLRRPVILLVAIEVAAAAAYLLAVWRLRTACDHRPLLVGTLLLGVALRLTMLPTTPILETDFYRYLWDGGVLAHGMNPYAFSPLQVLAAATDTASQPLPPAIRQLSLQASPIVDRIGHPNLRTIYPPVAQAAFALAHLLSPWSTVAWRLVRFGFGLAAIALLLAILKTLDLPLFWAGFYWCNPLIIKELFNSAHMDAVTIPFVLAAILLAIRNRPIPAVTALALAVGAKLWPLILLPLLLRYAPRRPKQCVAAAGLFALLCAVILLPCYVGRPNEESGFAAYARSWQANDALFKLIVWTAQPALAALHLHPGHAYFTARLIVIVLIAACVAWLIRTPAKNPRDFCRRCLLAVAALFLLSPTQFPWYYVWLAPLLAIRPRRSLLLLTALLPLYYLRFYLDARGQADLFDYGVVWIEYVPVWLLLLQECWPRHSARSPTLPEASGPE